MVINFFFSPHIILTWLHYFLIAPHKLLQHTHLTVYPQILSCQPSSATHGIAEFTWNVKGGEGIEE